MALLNNGRPAELVQLTLATLPTSVTNIGHLIYVTDANGGAGAVAYGAGAGSPVGEAITWIDITTGAAVV